MAGEGASGFEARATWFVGAAVPVDAVKINDVAIQGRRTTDALLEIKFTP